MYNYLLCLEHWVGLLWLCYVNFPLNVIDLDVPAYFCSHFSAFYSFITFIMFIPMYMTGALLPLLKLLPVPILHITPLCFVLSWQAEAVRISRTCYSGRDIRNTRTVLPSAMEDSPKDFSSGRLLQWLQVSNNSRVTMVTKML